MKMETATSRLALLGLPDHGSLLTVEMHGLLAPGVDVGLLDGGKELGLGLSAHQSPAKHINHRQPPEAYILHRLLLALGLRGMGRRDGSGHYLGRSIMLLAGDVIRPVGRHLRGVSGGGMAEWEMRSGVERKWTTNWRHPHTYTRDEAKLDGRGP